jgi:hypothetical protein
MLLPKVPRAQIEPTESEPRSWRVVAALATMVVVSIVLRSFFALKHGTARFFPDEYTYASLGRSIGHGHYAIRGVTAHFPAFLEPLLTAPIWATFSTLTAYHLIQVENAILMSLGCIPVYLLARYLGLSKAYSLACGAYAIAIPALMFIAFNLSDPVAYPFALATVTAGVRALDRPTTKRQTIFLILAGLATVARIQYVALPAAYLVAAIVIERRRFPRAHWLVLSPIVPTLLAVLLLGPSRTIGFYSDNPVFRLNFGVVRSLGHWVAIHLYLLALTSGVAIVPGAIAGLVKPRGRAERAFALMGAALLLLLLIQASSYSTLAAGRFRERYVFLVLPLLPIAFGLYLKHGRPLRWLVIVLAAVIAIAVARLPLSAYAVPGLSDDSPFLFAVTFLQEKVGIDSASLIAAAAATVAAAASIAIAFRGRGLAAVVAMIALASLLSVGATARELAGTRMIRAHLPHNLTWIDDASHASVTAISTPNSDSRPLLNPMYWNTSVQREMTLDGAFPSDQFHSTRVHIGKTGMLNARGNLLFAVSGTTVWLDDGKTLARQPNFLLWHPNHVPHLRLLIEGRYDDGWLNGGGRIRAWPRRFSDGTTLSSIGGLRMTMEPGIPRRILCRSALQPLDVHFSSDRVVADANFRRLTVKMIQIKITDVRRRPRGLRRTACSAQS